MADSTISTAVQRVERAFAHKPAMALQPDSPAEAVLTGGLGMEVRHPKGHTIRTDMPEALGGGGAEVTPGWLMRAGLASCTATVIALRAERLGIRLTRLKVTVGSRSDARGMLGLDPAVPAGPLEIDMNVEVAADDTDPAALEELVDWADEHSPIGNAVRRPLGVRLVVNGRPRTGH